MSTDASERGLYFPAVAAGILLAPSLSQIGPIARRLPADDQPPNRFFRIFGWYVLLGILVPGALLSVTMPFSYLPSLEKPGKQALAIVPYIERSDPEHVLILNTPGCFHTFYPLHLKKPIDHQGLLFIQWDGKSFRPLELEKLATSEEHTLADTSDVWASMM